jgi:hypothetical protein
MNTNKFIHFGDEIPSPPTGWDSYLRPLVFPEVVQNLTTDFLSIPEAREAIDAALARSGDMALGCTAGIGKTTTVKRYMSARVAAGGQRILYATPGKDEAKNIFAALSGCRAPVELWETRNERNCSRPRECQRMHSLKRSVYSNICKKRCRRTGKNRCPYLSQLDKFQEGIIVCTHAGIGPAIGKLRKLEAERETNLDLSLVVFDESPMATGTIIKQDGVQAEKTRILDGPLGKTAWWRKIRQAAGPVLDQIEARLEQIKAEKGDRPPILYARIPLRPDANYVEDMKGDAAWEGLQQTLHTHRCEEERERIEKYNKTELVALNEQARKKYDVAEKAEKKLMGLVVRNGFQPLPPLPYAEPPYDPEDEPDRETWGKEWKESLAARTWTPGDGEAYRAAGITAVDMVEAMVEFQEAERIYLEETQEDEDKPTSVDPLEMEIIAVALCGSDDGYAYLDLSVEPTKKGMKRNIDLRFIHKKNLDIGDAPIVVLDATGDRQEIEGAFGRPFEFVAANVRPAEGSKMVYVQYNLGGRKAKEMIVDEETERIEHYLKIAIDELTMDDKKVLIATHKIIQDNIDLAALANEYSSMSREFKVMHYFEGRGTNKYEDCDAFIALGTPYISPMVSEPAAEILFGPEGNKIWIGRRGLQELIQTVYRIRPIYGRKTIVIVGQVWPTESLGKPEIWDMRRKGGTGKRIENTVELLSEKAKIHGFMSLALANDCGHFDRRERAAIAAYEAKEGVRPDIWPSKAWADVLRGVAARTGLPVVQQHRSGTRGPGLLACGSLDAIGKFEEGLAWARVREKRESKDEFVYFPDQPAGPRREMPKNAQYDTI